MVHTVSENAAIKSLYLLVELDCTGEYLKPVIMDNPCNIEISGDKRKSAPFLLCAKKCHWPY